MSVLHSARKHVGIELTEEDLDKELPPRVLTPFDPHAASNTAVYSFKDRRYIVSDRVPSLIAHFSSKSTLTRPAPDPVPDTHSKAASVNPSRRSSVKSVNLVRNQFCFHDRSCETGFAGVVDCGGGTTAPPSRNWNMCVTKMLIYDKYVSAAVDAHADSDDPPEVKFEMDAVYSEEMKSSCRIVERLVNLNQESEWFKAFKGEAEVSASPKLSPVFRFSSLKTRGKQITCIKWNRRYSDLFAVAYGSYEFSKQSEGCVAIYSMKNSKHPELVIPTPSTVCSLDWHPTKSALLALGLYDGNVGVLDVRNSRSREFIFKSSAKKHLDPIWEVQWLPGESETSMLAFHSVSADGSIYKWTLKKSQLACEPLVRTGGGDHPNPAGGNFCSNSLCFDFTSFGDKSVFLVGTEEGKIYRCSRYYPNRFEAVYHGHSMPVYAVKWNPFHPDVFISASADWSVKVWNQHSTDGPICAFELTKGAIGDVDWCPINSAVFAAANADGTVHVFDAETNRTMEIAAMKVSKAGRVTKVKFSNCQPILLAGDDAGNVYCMKIGGLNLEGDNKARIEKVVSILSIKDEKAM